MKKYISLIFFMLVLVFSVFAGGCTSESESELPVQTISQTPMSEISIISYEKTPVSYLDLSYNVSLAYREFGKPDSEPLLMIIGFGGTMDSWNTTFISLLSENYHVYIYDHRDMGESSKTLSNFTIYDLSDDAANLITGLGYDSMNTYSVSMGSTVAQQLLISHPEKVRKAVLSSATYSVLIPKTEVLHGLIEDALTNPDSSEGVVKEAVANLGYPGCYDNLSPIKNDIMLITGTEDIITPQSVAVLIADRINGSWLVRFKGIPHMGSSYAPYEYAEITKIFLEMNETPT